MAPTEHAPLGLRPVVTADDPVIDRLWQLYLHDPSESRGSLPNGEGLFKFGHLAIYRADPADYPGFLVTYDGAPAGCWSVARQGAHRALSGAVGDRLPSREPGRARVLARRGD